MKIAVRGLLGILGVLGLWELGSLVGLFPEYYLPPPSTVLPRLVELFGDDGFVRAVVATMLAWAIGMVIATAIAVPAGLLLGSIPSVRIATRTIIEFLRPIPSVALIPLVIVLVGAGPEAKISLAVYAALWPIMFNTVYALDEIDPLLIDTARAMGLGRVRTMYAVALPHAAPFILTGVRMSSAVTLIVVISVEYLAGGTIGLGTFTLEAASTGGRQDLVLAATMLAGLIGYLIDEGMQRLRRRAFGWAEAT
ncbi:ABC transporter permease [Amycolatopsis suaedae]|uniref:ABC transporter permease n=1 Tax=Amycolatopsis suaedae TaxID=2510978 RepID=A0A4Q7JE17_9PSEU|nr:ABC transporter permease [Amycolatopsis suaedae]RZQ65332.1 ABC transporter permease [Amycolatopsis suaedae]